MFSFSKSRGIYTLQDTKQKQTNLTDERKRGANEYEYSPHDTIQLQPLQTAIKRNRSKSSG